MTGQVHAFSISFTNVFGCDRYVRSMNDVLVYVLSSIIIIYKFTEFISLSVDELN